MEKNKRNKKERRNKMIKLKKRIKQKKSLKSHKKNNKKNKSNNKYRKILILYRIIIQEMFLINLERVNHAKLNKLDMITEE